MSAIGGGRPCWSRHSASTWRLQGIPSGVVVQVTERRRLVRPMIANRAGSPCRKAKSGWRAITVARSIVAAAPSSQTICRALTPAAETACKVRVDCGSSIGRLREVVDDAKRPAPPR